MSFARRFLVLALAVTFSGQAAADCESWLAEFNALVDSSNVLYGKIYDYEGGSEELCRSYVEGYRRNMQELIDLRRHLDACPDVTRNTTPEDWEHDLASSAKLFKLCPDDAAKSDQSGDSDRAELDVHELRKELVQSQQFYQTLIFGIVAGFAVVLGLAYVYFSRRLGSLSEPARIVSQSLTTMFRREAPGAGRVGGTVARQTGLQMPATEAHGAIGEVKLIPSEGGRPITLDAQRLRKGGVVIGRSSNCDVVLTDNRVSGRHARIWRDETGALRIEDLGSANGTWRGGKRIERGGLGAGDEVRFGAVAFKVRY
jgi:hypothetical protein